MYFTQFYAVMVKPDVSENSQVLHITSMCFALSPPPSWVPDSLFFNIAIFEHTHASHSQHTQIGGLFSPHIPFQQKSEAKGGVFKKDGHKNFV
jgi:hypothetical protein